jgi:ribosomal protein S27AE
MPRRRIILLRVTQPPENATVVFAAPRIEGGGDIEFTCAGCGQVVIVANEEDMAQLVIHCGNCDTLNSIGGATPDCCHRSSLSSSRPRQQ